jgi:hypothetical protein
VKVAAGVSGGRGGGPCLKGPSSRRQSGTGSGAFSTAPSWVWDLVSDVTRVGEFSPETFEAEWLGGATGPAVGARFRGHVRRNGRGPVCATVCTVTACDPGREFGFAVGGPGGRILNTWGYQLEPGADGGTDVTESFELPSTPLTRLADRRVRAAAPTPRACASSSLPDSSLNCG